MKKLLLILMMPFMSLCEGWSDAVPFYFAAVSGDTAEVQSFLDKGLDANSKTPRGFTALQAAVSNNDLDMVQLLVRHGADVTMKCSEKEYTPLHVAAEAGHVEIVRFLLDHGADIDATTSDNETPLILAVDENQQRVVELLLAWQQAASETALNSPLSDLLPAYSGRVDIEHADDHGTALHHAVDEENVAIASLLIQHGALVNCVDGQGNTPLHAAAEHGNLRMVKLLKENAALMNMRNLHGVTPLLCAVLGHKACIAHIQVCQCAPNFQNIAVVKYLLDNGANPNIVCNEMTALHYAAEDDNFEIAYLLIKAGADVDHIDSRFETPLQNAVDRGHLRMVKLLLHGGADMYAKHAGYTPFVSALANGHDAIVREFIMHGFDTVGVQVSGLERFQDATPQLQRMIPQALREAIEEHEVPAELQQMVLSYLSPTVWQSAE